MTFTFFCKFLKVTKNCKSEQKGSFFMMQMSNFDNCFFRGVQSELTIILKRFIAKEVKRRKNKEKFV